MNEDTNKQESCWKYLLDSYADIDTSGKTLYWIKKNGTINLMAKSGKIIFADKVFSLDNWCGCVSVLIDQGKQMTRTQLIQWDSIESIEFTSNNNAPVIDTNIKRCFSGEKYLDSNTKDSIAETQIESAHVLISYESIAETQVEKEEEADNNFLEI